ncbi:MAG: 30S ribosomal protein S16 [Dehalococcoidia bacterium]|nr:30S ribosomal protein S16 [Dehalococcoidia bacterium]
MIKIRLARVGRSKIPNYKVVVMDSRSPRNGRAIDIIGHYDPLTDPETVVIDAEKAARWLKQGAQPTPAVQRFLSKLSTKEKSASPQESA